MGTLGYWLLALVGLGMVRGTLYRPHWGHGQRLALAAGLALEVAMIAPLWIASPGARPWLAVLGVVVVTPWKHLALFALERQVRRSLTSLARSWGATLQEDGGLFSVQRPAGGAAPEAWVGNVLTHVRSLHPGVATRVTYRMLAFVVRLDRPPSFRCSLTKGWSAPKYHEVEWRQDTSMQGDLFALSMGGLLAEGGRETGGKVADLTQEAGADDQRFEVFYALLCSDAERFASVFQGDLLEAFFASAFQTVQYELNVTPTSVNIYTTYCGQKQIRANLDFLELLAQRVNSAAA